MMTVIEPDNTQSRSTKSRLQDLNKDYFALIGLLVVHIALNFILHFQGLAFNLSPLSHFYQYLDPAWLQDNLFESLLHLHSQPPLFNLLIGFILKLFGENPLAFEVLYQLLSLLTVASMFLVLRKLRVNLLLTCLIVLILIFYPAFIYFQHYLFYPLPVITLLVFAVYLLVKSEQSRNILYLYGFFLVLAILGLLRSTYNPIYISIVLALLVALRWDNRRTILKASIPAYIILGILIAKNLILFDQISTSSWVGMNLAKSTVQSLTGEQKQSLVESGLVSEVVLVAPFQDIYEYPDHIWQPASDNCQGPVALCKPFRKSGDPNFNYIGYIPISNAYLLAGLYTIRHYPLQYLLNVQHALRLYFTPAHRTVGVAETEFSLLRGWADPVDNILCEKISDQYGANRCTTFGIGVFFILLAGSLICILPFTRKKSSTPDTPLRCLATWFIVLTVLYNFLVGILIDVGENNRFRLEIDPLLLILLGIIIQNLVELLQSWWRDHQLT